ncbi:SH3 domain-containing protein, partial [Fischerella sp.]|uniref:SH3 domain-containing protein n=1 Tax=Fischerella sp. TaxID=1191 RepID=UPI0025BA49BE
EYRSTYVLRQGDRVEIIERKGEWSKIVGERGGEGWVYARLLMLALFQQQRQWVIGKKNANYQSPITNHQ